MGALKDDLHNLTRRTTNERVLKGIVMVISSRNNFEDGLIWETLTEEQKQQTLKSES